MPLFLLGQIQDQSKSFVGNRKSASQKSSKCKVSDRLIEHGIVTDASAAQSKNVQSPMDLTEHGIATVSSEEHSLNPFLNFLNGVWNGD